MAFRTHVGRPMDLSYRSNRFVIGLAVMTLVAAVVIWLTSDDSGVLWAPLHTFFVWALGREIDPDHDSTALIAGLIAGVWALAGLPVLGVLAVVGILLAARLVVNSTGRRPLVSDLIGLGVLATAVSFTTAGWVAGFGLAIAIYIDDRMADEQTTTGAMTAVLAALGASGVASLSRVFPQEIPSIRPLFVIAVGVLGLIAVVRDPTPPTTLVDSRLKTPIDRARLHASRSLTGVLLLGAAFLLGPDAVAVAPLAVTLALGLATTEVVRIRQESAD